jgi:hypothetical protein
MSSKSVPPKRSWTFVSCGTRIAIVTRFSIVKTAISASVQRFLRHDIGSPESLNILLLMRRDAQRWWAAHELADELGMQSDTAQKQLERLSARNLLDVRIAESLRYRYRPGAGEIARLVDQVSRAFERDHQAIHDLLSGRPRG